MSEKKKKKTRKKRGRERPGRGGRGRGVKRREKIMMMKNSVACVANVSVRFRSKEQGMIVKDSAKNGAS